MPLRPLTGMGEGSSGFMLNNTHVEAAFVWLSLSRATLADGGGWLSHGLGEWGVPFSEVQECPKSRSQTAHGASCRLALEDINEPMAACSGVSGYLECGLLNPVSLVPLDRCPLKVRCRVRPWGAGGERGRCGLCPLALSGNEARDGGQAIWAI